MTTHTSPVTVLIPLLGTVTTPRTGRERTGFVWVERVVDVPVLESDARCTVFRPRASPHPVPRYEGACAGGAHWRVAAGDDPFHNAVGWTDDGVVRPYRLVTPDPPVPVSITRIDWGSRIADPMSSEVFHLSRRHGVTTREQGALRRYHAERDTLTGDLSDEDGGLPFRTRDDHAVRLLSPGLETTLLERVRSELAKVDGEFMLRSPPPETRVEIDGHSSTLKASVLYPDSRGAMTWSSSISMPLAARDDVATDLVELCEDGTAPRNWSYGPTRTVAFEGRTVVPDRPSDRLDVLGGWQTGRGREAVEELVRWKEGFLRRHSFTVPTEDGISAPADLDALDAFDAPGP